MKPDNNNILNKLKEILQTYAMEKPIPDCGKWVIKKPDERYARILPKGTVKLVYPFPSTCMNLPFAGAPMIQPMPLDCYLGVPQKPVDITEQPNSPCCDRYQQEPLDTTICPKIVVKVDKDFPYKLPPGGPDISNPNPTSNPSGPDIWVSCVRGSSEGREQIICTTLQDIQLRHYYTAPR